MSYPEPPPLPSSPSSDESPPNNTTYFRRSYQLVSSSRTAINPVGIPIRHTGKHDVVFLRDIQRVLPNVTCLKLNGDVLPSLENDEGLELDPVRYEAIEGRVLEGIEPADERTELMRGLLRQATDLVVQLRALSQELRHNRAVAGGGPPARSFRLLEDIFRSIGEDAAVGGGPSTSRGMPSSAFAETPPSYPSFSGAGSTGSSHLAPPPSYIPATTSSSTTAMLQPPSYPAATIVSHLDVTTQPPPPPPGLLPSSTLLPPDYAQSIATRSILPEREIDDSASPSENLDRPTILANGSANSATLSEPPSYAP